MPSRIVFISNPRSSNHRKVKQQILNALKKQVGELVEYKIVHTFYEDNVERISKLLEDGDLVIAAGGDGTASIVGNGIIASGKRSVTLGVLGYGNFNDLATSLNGRHARVEQLLDAKKKVDFYPVGIALNGKHFRYSFMYADIGLVAGAVNEFEKAPERGRLQRGWANQFLSFMALLPYYLKNKRRYQLPESSLGAKKLTDFFVVNGDRMAKFKIGRGFTGSAEMFGVFSLNTSSLLKNVPFTWHSVRGHMQLKHTKNYEVSFTQAVNIDFQSDGEYRELKSVKTICFTKPKTPVKVIKLRS
jgi:diacylglycerol kinase family enzyme